MLGFAIAGPHPGRVTSQDAIHLYVADPNDPDLPGIVAGLDLPVAPTIIRTPPSVAQPGIVAFAGGGAPDWPRPSRRHTLWVPIAGNPTNWSRGTLGLLVVRNDPADNGLYILSNEHVLRPSGVEPADHPVYHAQRRTQVFAKLTDWCGLSPTPGTINTLDAAIARVEDDQINFARSLHAIPNIGRPAQTTARPTKRLPVHKHGSTTDHTRGRVSPAVLVADTIRYPHGNAMFADVVEVFPTGRRPFSRPGDSGSLIACQDPANRGTALLFAGSSARTLGCDLDKVFAALDIRPYQP